MEKEYMILQTNSNHPSMRRASFLTPSGAAYLQHLKYLMTFLAPSGAEYAAPTALENLACGWLQRFRS
jgi:hypothetical protein